MSDAFHLLSDVASFIVALAAIYLAEKPATRRKLHFIFLSLKLE
jgi:Co/Zn/Cd efflux system component